MGRRIQIVSVCGAGVATSLMAKMNIEKIAKENGYNVTVNAADVGTAAGMQCDVYVTTNELGKSLRLPSYNKAKVVLVHNLVKKSDIEEQLIPVLKELTEE